MKSINKLCINSDKVFLQWQVWWNALIIIRCFTVIVMMKCINNYVKCIMNKKWFKLDNSGCWTSCPWSHPLPLTIIPSNQWPLNPPNPPPCHCFCDVCSVARCNPSAHRLHIYFLWGCSVARCNPSAYSLHLFSCNKYSLLTCPLIPPKYSLPASIIPTPSLV